MKKIYTLLLLSLSAIAVSGQVAYYQQCDKMTAPVPTANAGYGFATSLSADGSTAVVGASGDNGNTGVSYFYTRSGCIWAQTAKLVGTGNVGAAYQGQSVAMSADGNTAVIGGPGDNGTIGAAWVFVKAGGTWSQQAKLVGTGSTGTPLQGYSVSISGDGNTIVIGGPFDNTDIGAIWVFSRSGTTWSQMGAKIVGSGYSFSNVEQGTGTAISADGNTIAFGGPKDIAGKGSVWFFSRSGNTWNQLVRGNGSTYDGLGNSIALSADGSTAAVGAAQAGNGSGVLNKGFTAILVKTGATYVQQGGNLIGTNPVGDAQQGSSVSLSSDGNTLVVGGGANVYSTSSANLSAGQLWVWTRVGNTWAQQGQKYIGTGAAGNSQQGSSVSISGDSKTIMTGGFADNNVAGAVWTYANTQCTSACPPLAIGAVAGMDAVRIFPNPSNGSFSVNIPGNKGQDVAVTITSAMGQKVRQLTVPANTNSTILLDVPAGLYYFNATDAAGKSMVTRLQIVR